jgi:hypothetical protein
MNDTTNNRAENKCDEMIGQFGTKELTCDEMI